MPSTCSMRAATAADMIARRATTCSFSSAFHIRGGRQEAAFSSAVGNVYMALVAPAVFGMGAVALWRLGKF